MLKSITQINPNNSNIKSRAKSFHFLRVKTIFLTPNPSPKCKPCALVFTRKTNKLLDNYYELVYFILIMGKCGRVITM